MKNVKSTILTFLCVMGSSQAFAMGAKAPNLGQSQSGSSSGNIIGQLISTVLPLATSMGGVGGVGSLANIIVPLLSSGAQSSLPTLDQGSASAYIDQIKALAMASACSDYSWSNQGQAPSDFLPGVSLSYARGICQLTQSKNFSFITTTGLNDILMSALANQSKLTGFRSLNIQELVGVPACAQLLTDVRSLINNDQYTCQDI